MKSISEQILDHIELKLNLFHHENYNSNDFTKNIVYFFSKSPKILFFDNSVFLALVSFVFSKKVLPHRMPLAK